MKTPKKDIYAPDKVNYDLSRDASGILSIIGCHELQDFFNEVYKLFELYDTDKEIDDEFNVKNDTPINHLRLIQTARVMSRLSKKYERPFRKINKKYRAFDEHCESITKKVECKADLQGEK